MNSDEIRKIFLNFFAQRNHAIVPSSSLIPDDKSVLLTTAGMQQFKSYFTGKADPIRDFDSLNTVSVQKSFRTSDIDEVGDETHLTFFEMLGNFSFGGYFKKDAIKYAYDLIKEYGLDIQYVSVFEGDKDVPRDEDSIEIWKSLGIKDIREEQRSENFWGPTGSEGPCGPTTEIFVNNVEIWNIVFNEYYCSSTGDMKKLEIPGVDTGMGLERLSMVVQNKKHLFETDLFKTLLYLLPQSVDEKIKRIIVDHVRGIAFLISDGVRPSNKEAGYILRRLMRRVITHQYLYRDKKDNNIFEFDPIFNKIIEIYLDFYEELDLKTIINVFKSEEDKFIRTLSRGLRELNKLDIVNAASAFRLYESFGLPYEVIKDVGGNKTEGLKREDFDKEFVLHREVSRAGLEAKFGGHGLVLDTGEIKARNKAEVLIVTRLHTATHLLQAALRDVLGDSVHQAGSDINADRTRFDFTFDRRLTDEEVKKVENWVNDKIKSDLHVTCEQVPYEKAIKTGALYFEKENYPDMVKVYTVDGGGGSVSKELCGGPHVENTGTMGHFKIIKQESVAAGVRRIRARLE